DFEVVKSGEKNNTKYKVETKITKEGIRIVDLVFTSDPRDADFVDKTLRASLESVVAEDGSRDVLATAFVGDSVMNENQHSGLLFYRASDKKILTEDEWHEVKISNHERGSYFVETREEKTAKGITPARSWYTLKIVYPKKPSESVAYDAIKSEITKVADN